MTEVQQLKERINILNAGITNANNDIRSKDQFILDSMDEIRVIQKQINEVEESL